MLGVLGSCDGRSVVEEDLAVRRKRVGSNFLARLAVLCLSLRLLDFVPFSSFDNPPAVEGWSESVAALILPRVVKAGVGDVGNMIETCRKDSSLHSRDLKTRLRGREELLL